MSRSSYNPSQVISGRGTRHEEYDTCHEVDEYDSVKRELDFSNAATLLLNSFLQIVESQGQLVDLQDASHPHQSKQVHVLTCNKLV